MNKITTLLFIITIAGFSFNIYAQKQVGSDSEVKKTNIKEKHKIISLGVVNGRALNLVTPDYPPAARAIKLSGTVAVEIIIDEAGYVIEAKALSGHPLLRKSSLEAAKNSKFAPTFLDKTPVKVKGIIVYNFLSNNLNWLEIGYYSIETRRIRKSLPNHFLEEKKMILKMNSTETPYDPDGFKNLVFSINNKLRNDEKKFWLFNLGITLRKLVNNSWDRETINITVTEIQSLLYNKPQNVSPNLIINLENLVKLNKENSDVVTDEFKKILDKIYIFGR